MLLTQEGGLIHFSTKYANGAIADIIQREAITLFNQNDISLDDRNRKINELMGDAYKCFLRLNCPIDEGLWHSRKVKVQMNSHQIPEVEALSVSYMTLKKINPKASSKIPWDLKIVLLKSAIKECEKMFPLIAMKAASSQKRKRKKDDQTNTKHHTCIEKEESTGRKIVVKVPNSVNTGETFLVEVICEYFRQKVQLVSTGSKKILFHLNIPKNITSDIRVFHVGKHPDTYKVVQIAKATIASSNGRGGVLNQIRSEINEEWSQPVPLN